MIERHLIANRECVVRTACGSRWARSRNWRDPSATADGSDKTSLHRGSEPCGNVICMEAVHQILPGLIGNPKVKRSRRRSPLGFGTRQLFPPLMIIQPAWEHIVGPMLVNRTKPISVVAGHLVVEVPSVAWRVQLVSYEGALVDRIKHLLGDDSITGIDWKLNPALASTDSPKVVEPAIEAPPRKPPQRADDPTVREAAGAIADPELRELFLRQAARMMR